MPARAGRWVAGLAVLFALLWIVDFLGTDLPRAVGPVDPEENAPAPTLASPAAPADQLAEAREARAVDEPPPTAVPETVPTDPTETVLLYGTVSNSEGEPLEGAYVTVQHGPGQRLLGRTDAEGFYTIADIPPGEHLVTAGALDRYDAAVELELFEPETRQNFTLAEKQVIWVRLITSSGEPTIPTLKEAGLGLFHLQLVPVVTRDEPGTTFTAVAGSLNNTFGIGSFWQAGHVREQREPEYLGTVTLDEASPAWVSLIIAHQVVRTECVTPETEEVVFYVDVEDVEALLGSIRARLVAPESGAPLSGHVWYGTDPFPNGKPTEIGPDGIVDLEDRFPGRRFFVAQVEGRAMRVLELELARGEDRDLGDVPIHVPVRIRGKVVDEDGHPIAAILSWGRLEDGEIQWARQMRSRSQADGTFTTPDLEPGRYALQVAGLPAPPPHPPDTTMRSFVTFADARQGDVEGHEIVVRQTTPVLLRTNATAEPWPLVRALDLDGYRVDHAWPGRWSGETYLNLPPGSYDLIVTQDGAEVSRQALEVGTSAIEIRVDVD